MTDGISVVPFGTDATDQKVITDLLNDALEKAHNGRVVDVAIVTVERDPDEGPVFNIAYWGQGNYGHLLAGVSALNFDLHYRRYAEADE